MSTHHFPTRVNIPIDRRSPLISVLNQQLLDLLDLAGQTKYAHWNVKGPQFIALHELFDQLAKELRNEIDDTAERATALGGIAQGTASQIATGSRVADFPTDVFEGMAVVSALAERYAAVSQSARAAIDAADQYGDKVTADLLTGTTSFLDKSLWMLEAHLSNNKPSTNTP